MGGLLPSGDSVHCRTPLGSALTLHQTCKSFLRLKRPLLVESGHSACKPACPFHKQSPTLGGAGLRDPVRSKCRAVRLATIQRAFWGRCPPADTLGSTGFHPRAAT